ncbi:phage terminase large subunit [Melissospora conviva]|uniref:phage terminase large subunit n=1 Tax=Melissospora conviva TaxID=3388432 RepID=UPI003C145F63
MEKLRALRALKARAEDGRLAEARRRRESNRGRWPSPLDMACALDPLRVGPDGERAGMVRTPALELVNAGLVALADGGESRFAGFMPPQEGKSTLTSYWFPLWWLTCVNPETRVLITSYSDEMARRWGGEIKNALERWSGDEGTVDLGLRLRKDSRAAGRWNIAGHRGSIYCAGVNGSITGKPGDLILVDDPLRNMADAQSEKIREKTMSAYQSVLVPRMAPNARVAWIQTLWHEDEPILRILANEGERKDGGRWHVVRIPAVAETDDDVLGRKAGEGMVSARGQRDWQAVRKSVGEYVFSALYQQRPSPAEGNLFKRLWWRYWSPDPTGARLVLGQQTFALADCWRFATVDLAASTRTSADWTVFSAWARTITGDLVLLDRVRARIGEADHFAHARPLVERWRLDTVFVEASQYGMTLVREASNAGVPITPLQADTDKLSRALPASAWCSNGRVWLPAGVWWVKDWVNEHAAFPNGSHDDQVDTLAYAVRVAVTKPAPQRSGPARPQVDAWAASDIDLATVPL